MKKTILNLEGVEVLSKKQQKNLTGGTGPRRPDVPTLYDPVCYQPIYAQHSCLSQLNATMEDCGSTTYTSGAIVVSFGLIVPPPPGC